MNKVIQMGRLVADPEIRVTQGDNATTIAKFTIAVDRRYKREGQPDADFHSCVAFGKTAEFIEKYFTKGRKIAIVGSLEDNNYTKDDGTKVYNKQIRVEEVDFADSKTASDAPKSANTPSTDEDGFMSVPADLGADLPFA